MMLLTYQISIIQQEHRIGILFPITINLMAVINLLKVFWRLDKVIDSQSNCSLKYLFGLTKKI